MFLSIVSTREREWRADRETAAWLTTIAKSVDTKFGLNFSFFVPNFAFRNRFRFKTKPEKRQHDYYVNV